MLRTKYLSLAGCAVAALAFAGTMPAFADSSMCVDGMMVASDDAMMSEEHMTDDSMMADGEVEHDDAMGDAMSDDGMMSEDDAMMEEDSMMAEGEMAHDDAMGADAMGADRMGQYTVMAGDSLYTIAKAELCDGDRYPELIAANADVLTGTTMLQPGMMLTIPGD